VISNFKIEFLSHRHITKYQYIKFTMNRLSFGCEPNGSYIKPVDYHRKKVPIVCVKHQTTTILNNIAHTVQCIDLISTFLRNLNKYNHIDNAVLFIITQYWTKEDYVICSHCLRSLTYVSNDNQSWIIYNPNIMPTFYSHIKHPQYKYAHLYCYLKNDQVQYTGYTMKQALVPIKKPCWVRYWDTKHSAWWQFPKDEITYRLEHVLEPDIKIKKDDKIDYVHIYKKYSESEHSCKKTKHYYKDSKIQGKIIKKNKLKAINKLRSKARLQSYTDKITNVSNDLHYDESYCNKNVCNGYCTYDHEYTCSCGSNCYECGCKVWCQCDHDYQLEESYAWWDDY
jgi:hypothetical protein